MSRLSDNVLVSCAAPALMRGEHAEDMYEEPGEIVVWEWLGYDRFLKDKNLKPIKGATAPSIRYYNPHVRSTK